MRASCADEYLGREKFSSAGESRELSRRDEEAAANAKGESTRNDEKTTTFPQLHPRFIRVTSRVTHRASRSPRSSVVRDERRTISELSKSRSSKRRTRDIIRDPAYCPHYALEKRRHENTASGCPRFPQFRGPSLALAPLVRSRAAERESR